MDSDSNNDTGPWSFRQARRFLRSFHGEQPGPPSSSADSAIPNPALYNPKCSIPTSLGDFDRYFAFLGKPVNATRATGRRHSSTGSYILDIGDGVDNLDNLVAKAKEVRWEDQIGNMIAEVQKQSTSRLVKQSSDAGALAGLLEGSECSSGDETDPESAKSGPRSSITSHIPKPYSPLSATPLLKHPTHSHIVNLPPIVNQRLINSAEVQPLYTLTAKEQKTKLLRKLSQRFSNPELPFALSQIGTKTEDGIHIFVDCSNIIIGFYEKLKGNRGMNENRHLRQPPIAFHSLAMILERGRPTARRILVGSHSRPFFGQEHPLPHYALEAAKLGYEINMLERVQKFKRPRISKRRKHGSGSGYATTSGQSSGSEQPFRGALITTEQGVDEILQMKLLESLVDAGKPSTVVLASGDAAEAEFSGGFLKCVKRALLKGWSVEVVAWHAGLSQEYRSERFLKKWEGKFTVIELDDFAEEMLAIYTVPTAF